MFTRFDVRDVKGRWVGRVGRVDGSEVWLIGLID